MSGLSKRYLPLSLQRIAEFCGDGVMWSLWETFAGGRFEVPRKVAADHRLSELLGFAAACQFCQVFGGEVLWIAKADAAKRAVRDELIRLDDQAGLDVNALARKYGLSYRQIQTICRGNEPVAMNLDLFDAD